MLKISGVYIANSPSFFQANLIYLGVLTDRVPILPPFVPSHIGADVPPIAFGEVFDVPRLRQAVGPIVEWHEVKKTDSSELEHLAGRMGRCGLAPP
jgi:hypothetical protein